MTTNNLKNLLHDVDLISEPDYPNQNVNKRFEYCPLSAIISRYGFAQDINLSQSHKLANVTMNSHEAGMVFGAVMPSDRNLSDEIKKYYITAMGMLTLKGVEISDWRQSMVRVLRNADNCLIEHEDDWRILCRMVAFYVHDTAIDALTTQFSGVPSAYYNNLEHGWRTARVKLTQWLPSPVKTIGGGKKVYVFGHDSNNVLHKFEVHGNQTAQDFATIIAQSQMDVEAKFLQYLTRTSNGTCAEYIEVRNAKLSVITH